MTDRPASSRAPVQASGYPVPQITNLRMVLADLRREDGRALLAKMLGRGDLERLEYMRLRHPEKFAHVSAVLKAYRGTLEYELAPLMRTA